MRKTTFANGEFYHIYNRGVDKRQIFQDVKDTQRFLLSLTQFNTKEPIGSIYELSFDQSIKSSVQKPLVKILAYCLLPNHYHLILEQVITRGISYFIKRVSGGYTYYFNLRHKRSGSLFQGPFKCKHIKSNDNLLHLSVYVNLNHRAHQLGDPVSKLVLSSWDEYLGRSSRHLCLGKDLILDQFYGIADYQKFSKDSFELIAERKKEDNELDQLFLE